MTPLEEIKKRLEASTPGPWSYDIDEQEVHSDTMQDSTGDPAHIVMQLGVRKDLNGKFIAAAPTDISYLLERLQSAEEALKDVAKGHAIQEYSEDGIRNKILITPETEIARTHLEKYEPKGES